MLLGISIENLLKLIFGHLAESYESDRGRVIPRNQKPCRAACPHADCTAAGAVRPQAVRGADRRLPYAEPAVSDGHPQPERDAKARREMSRAAGIALIDMSWALEEGLAVHKGAGHTTMLLVGFAARGRRLLRAAYRLIDADERDTAAPLFRVLNEYVIVSRWLLQASAEEVGMWAVDDLHRRLTVIREVMADPKVHQDVKTALEEERQRTEAKIAEHGGDPADSEPAGVCPTCERPLKKRGRPRPPSLEAMASATDLSFQYSYGYRLQSQYDVHATTLAVDSAYDGTDDGWAVRPVPRFAMERYESYHVGALLLLDLLAPLTERVPELRWKDTAAMVRESLDAVTRATSAADRRGEL